MPYVPLADLPVFGGIDLLKESGAGAFSGQVTLAAQSAAPVNPFNRSYPMVPNANAFGSLGLAGNLAPAATIRCLYQPSVITAALINSLCLTLDSNKLTDVFAVRFRHQYKNRIFSKGRCTGIVFTQSAFGAPIYVDLSFNFRFGMNYGDSVSPDGTVPTFSAGSPVTGELVNRKNVCFGGSPTADQVKGFTLALSRQQTYVYSDCGTDLSADETVSGMFGGACTLASSATATIVPSSAMTIAIGTGGAGVNFALALDLQNVVTGWDLGQSVTQSGYSLIKTSDGSSPVTVTAL